MLIDLSDKVTGLDGKPIIEMGNEVSFAKVIANILIGPKLANPVKMYDLAVKLYAEEKIDLDEADAVLIRDIISNSENFSPLVKAPAIKKIDAAIRDVQNK